MFHFCFSISASKVFSRQKYKHTGSFRGEPKVVFNIPEMTGIFADFHSRVACMSNEIFFRKLIIFKAVMLSGQPARNHPATIPIATGTSHQIPLM
jgi:hypothetical protein